MNDWVIFMLTTNEEVLMRQAILGRYSQAAFSLSTRK